MPSRSYVVHLLLQCPAQALVVVPLPFLSPLVELGSGTASTAPTSTRPMPASARCASCQGTSNHDKLSICCLICHSTSINTLHGAMICLYQLGTWLLSVTRGWWEEFSGGAVCVCRQIPGGCDHHFCLHPSWAVEAGPAHGHVLVHPTNDFHCSLRAKPFGEGCLAVAHHAHSLQLHHTLCTGHQLQNLTKRLKGDKQHPLGDNH